MLPKTRRIQRALFSEFFSGGRRIVTPHFLVNVMKMENVGQLAGGAGGRNFGKGSIRPGNFGNGTPSRFAFSVPKKICKKAVDRNLLRRRGHSIISKHLKKIPPGFLFVFTFKKGNYPIIFSEMEKEICDIITNTSK